MTRTRALISYCRPIPSVPFRVSFMQIPNHFYVYRTVFVTCNACTWLCVVEREEVIEVPSTVRLVFRTKKFKWIHCHTPI